MYWIEKTFHEVEGTTKIVLEQSMVSRLPLPVLRNIDTG